MGEERNGDGNGRSQRGGEQCSFHGKPPSRLVAASPFNGDVLHMAIGYAVPGGMIPAVLSPVGTLHCSPGRQQVPQCDPGWRLAGRGLLGTKFVLTFAVPCCVATYRMVSYRLRAAHCAE